MPWAKIDDGLHASEKFAAVSLAATGLWTLCLSWTTDTLKDGFIPAAMVRRFAGAETDALAAELVDAGLWETEPGGWRVHDYLEYNMPAEKVKAERAAARERMSKRRSPELRPNESRSSPSPTPHTPHPEPLYTDSGRQTDRPRARAQTPGPSVRPSVSLSEITKRWDEDPERCHWPDALLAHLAEAKARQGVGNQSRWLLSVAQNWEAGDGAPPMSSQIRDAPARTTPTNATDERIRRNRAGIAEDNQAMRDAIAAEREREGAPMIDPFSDPPRLSVVGRT